MKRIFVLHEEVALLKAYKEFLSSLGYEVFATSNHYKFLLYTGEISSDLLIFDTEDRLDINFIKALKNQEKTKNIPLLLITNRDNRNRFSAEITHVLFKPFDISDFIKILQQYESDEQNLSENAVFYVENMQKHQDLSNILS